MCRFLSKYVVFSTSTTSLLVRIVAHAHKQCWQFIIAASGALEVYLNDGHAEKVVTLNRPFQGLLVPPGVWAHEQEFTTGALCLVLASHDYSEDDYIRNFDDYLKYLAQA